MTGEEPAAVTAEWACYATEAEQPRAVSGAAARTIGWGGEGIAWLWGLTGRFAMADCGGGRPP